MKKIIVIFIVSVLFFTSCNTGTPKELKASWETEQYNKHKLIRPVKFGPTATDVYGFPLDSNRWYLISTVTECYPAPVKEPSGTVSFIETQTIQRNAILNTVNPRRMQVMSGRMEGLNFVDEIEILCFETGEVIPEYIGYVEIAPAWKKKD